jgi:hypothetical protein
MKATESLHYIRNLVKALEDSGATVQRVDGEESYGAFNIIYQSKVWDVLEEWGRTVRKDPWITINFTPSIYITFSSHCPPNQWIGDILREATSIVFHYSTLRMEDFLENPFPLIDPPLEGPPMQQINVHHASVALCKLIERIQNPPPNYQTIYNLNSGSYICTVVQHWQHLTLEIVVFKG